jgi:hypothetical protein
MSEKRARHPEVAILEDFCLYILRKTGSGERTDECMRRAMEFLFFDDADAASAYAKNPERFFDGLIQTLERIPGEIEAQRTEQEFGKASVARLTFKPEIVKQMRRDRLRPKPKDWSKQAPPHPSESPQKRSRPEDGQTYETGPDRSFWQLCRRAGISQMTEYLLPAERVKELVIQLNDDENPIMIRLLIAEEVFETALGAYCYCQDEDEELSEMEKALIERWVRQYMRCCRLLGGFIRSSETHPESNPMLRYAGLSKERKKRIKEQLEAEGLFRLD